MKKSSVILRVELSDGTVREWTSDPITMLDYSRLNHVKHGEILSDLIKTENGIVHEQFRELVSHSKPTCPICKRVDVDVANCPKCGKEMCMDCYLQHGFDNLFNS